MPTIEGYKVLNQIHVSRNAIIYRALRNKDHKRVIIKILKNDLPSSDEINKFTYEYDIAKNLYNINGIIKYYELIKHKNTLAIIMEDIDGISLSEVIYKNNFNINEFLKTAIKINDIIYSIHKAGIIHKDIKPANIIINPNNNEIRLIDFHIATQMIKEKQELTNPEILEGTLAYISPEQTGRINRTIDYRTDFYSLGVTFYEMLTRRLPFDDKDPMELVYSHIAKKPIPPHLINHEIPIIISNIIMKLLSKNAEDRYQSSIGLKHDLEKCINSFRSKGKIENFILGKKDPVEIFQISQNIYGRDRELGIIQNLIEKASQGSKEILLVSGNAGIGKSVLINESYKYITQKKGFFITGKYENLKFNIPYHGITQAFQELIRIILTETQDKIDIWKKKILKAIGNDGMAIINIIPELEIIIGKQYQLEELSLKESQIRFNMIFERFIKVFASNDHPIVLFLDDIQWIDDASMQLIDVILKDIELKYILIIAAYRDNENNDFFINKFKSNKINITSIKLEPLTKNDINIFLSKTFKGINNFDPLSNLILSKTKGNPFFIIEFLKTLYSNNLIKFDNEWKYDIDKIKNIEATDNVIDYIVDRIKKLPEDTLVILKIASCIGSKSQIGLLSVISNFNYIKILNDLKIAFDEGIIIKEKDSIKFTHDRIKDAIYQMFPKSEKNKIHYIIGKTLLKNESNKENLFEIVNHLNIASDLLNEKERKRLIILNLKAGNNAKKNSAFTAASSFYNNGIRLLNKDAWESQYEITLQLHIELVESEYMSIAYDKAEKLFKLLLKKARKTEDVIKVYEIMIIYYINKIKYKEAIKLGIEVVNKLGFKYPKIFQINIFSIIFELIKFNKLLKNKLNELNADSIEKLSNLPVLKNTLKNKIINILYHIGMPFYSIYPNKYPFFILKFSSLALREGLTAYSSAGFVPLGSVFTIGFNKYKLGYDFGKLALKLTNKFKNKYISTFVKFTFGTILQHFIKHFKEDIKYLREALNDGISSGNIQWTAYSINLLCIKYLIIGNNLDFVKTQYDKYTNLFIKLNEKDAFNHFFPVKQFVYNLLGLSSNIHKLKGEFFNEDIEIPKSIKLNHFPGLMIIYSFKTFLSIILEDFKSAYKSAIECEKYLNSDQAQIQNLFAHFFITLAYLKNIDANNKKQKSRHLKIANKYLAKIKKWHESCEANFSQLYYLLLAEIANVNNHDDKAISYYNTAINFAKKYEFIYIEALTNELAASFYKSRGIKTVSLAYLTEAVYLYKKWGAIAKINQIKKSNPEVFEHIYSREYIGENTLLSLTEKESSSGLQSSSMSLDIESIIKAAQLIAGEIEMNGLLTNLIKLILINSGAQKSIIAMYKNNKLLIEAEYRVDQSAPNIMKDTPIEKYSNIPHSVINYVDRTGEIILINDTSKKNRFTDDPYIKNKKTKSIMCIPIMQQKNILGILYLENNLTINAFTLKHQEITKIIASLAATSIENVFLYENLKEKELLEKELKIASSIQKSMLPVNLPKIKGYDIYAECIMAKEAGGDFYDIIKIDDSKYLITIGDISGKGMSAALYMSSTLNIIRTLVEIFKNKKMSDNLNSIYISKQVNKLLIDIMQRGKFATIIIGILDIKSNIFKFTSNGHEPFVIYNPVNKNFSMHNTKGQACGIIQPEIFDKSIEEKEIKIRNGDYILFNTDGVTEAKNINNIEYMERYYDSIKTLKDNKDAKQSLKYLIKKANDFSKNTPQYDDITMICIKKEAT
jgi:predicted ATPase/serine phosphatase RsbU (regulator of sigma subunit)